MFSKHIHDHKNESHSRLVRPKILSVSQVAIDVCFNKFYFLASALRQIVSFVKLTFKLKSIWSTAGKLQVIEIRQHRRLFKWDLQNAQRINRITAIRIRAFYWDCYVLRLIQILNCRWHSGLSDVYHQLSGSKPVSRQRFGLRTTKAKLSAANQIGLLDD